MMEEEHVQHEHVLQHEQVLQHEPQQQQLVHGPPSAAPTVSNCGDPAAVSPNVGEPAPGLHVVRPGLHVVTRPPPPQAAAAMTTAVPVPAPTPAWDPPPALGLRVCGGALNQGVSTLISPLLDASRAEDSAAAREREMENGMTSDRGISLLRSERGRGERCDLPPDPTSNGADDGGGEQHVDDGGDDGGVDGVDGSRTSESEGEGFRINRGRAPPVQVDRVRTIRPSCLVPCVLYLPLPWLVARRISCHFRGRCSRAQVFQLMVSVCGLQLFYFWAVQKRRHRRMRLFSSEFRIVGQSVTGSREELVAGAIAAGLLMVPSIRGVLTATWVMQMIAHARMKHALASLGKPQHNGHRRTTFRGCIALMNIRPRQKLRPPYQRSTTPQAKAATLCLPSLCPTPRVFAS